MTKPSPTMRIGSILDGRYRILRRLAVGSMGAVYHGERLKLGRPVAIKFLHPQIEADEQFKERFQREALAMSQLAHPNCISVIDFGRSEGAPYIVMDFAEGESLQDILSKGRLKPERAVALSRQILAGLEHAHRQGIIHRDIKPSNVMLTDYPLCGEVARLVDFGLAALRGKRKRRDITNTEVVVGTPSYMSPEQTRGHKVDERADVYGLGVLLFQMLTGQRPYEADDTMRMLRLHQEAPIPNIRDRVTGVRYSNKLQAAVRKSLAKKPEDRYSSAMAFAQALSEVPEANLGRRSPTLHKTPAYRDPDTYSAMRIPSNRRRWLVTAAAIAVLLTGGGIAKNQFRKVAENGYSETKTVISEAPAVAPVSQPITEAPPRIPLAKPVELHPIAKLDGDQVDNIVSDEPLADSQTSSPEGIALVLGSAPVVSDALSARAAFNSGYEDLALDSLETLKKERPRNAPLYLALGDLYFKKGEIKKSLRRYRRAIDLESSYKRKRRLQSNVIASLGDDDARPLARKIILFQLKDRVSRRLRRASKRNDDPAVRDHAMKLYARFQ